MSNQVPLIAHYDLVIYHKGCSDGIGASWVYWNLLKKENKLDTTVFYGAQAGSFPTDVDFNNKNVLLVDLCFSKEKIEELSIIVSNLTILDHHKSAMTDIKSIFDKEHCKLSNDDCRCEGWHIELSNDTQLLVSLNCKVDVFFDMERCGTELSWDHFHREDEMQGSWIWNLLKDQNRSRPWFVQVIADRDLWKWEDPRSKALGTYMFQMGMNDWQSLDDLLECEEDEIDSMFVIGSNLLEIHDRKVAEVCKKAILTNLVTPSGKSYNVYLVPCDHMLASDVGNVLSKKEECDWAAMWRYDYEENKFWISARANKDTSDLSVISKEFGGGGHRLSSGMSFPNSEEGLKKYFKKIA